jgi:hypothetical protein
MDKIEDMNSFFTFLQDHIEKDGFQNMKNKYLVSESELCSYKLDENGTYVFEPWVYEDYVTYPAQSVEGGQIYECEKFIDYLWINSKKLSLHKKTLYDNGKVFEDITEYFYDDLVRLYKEQMGNLKKCFANSLMKDVSDVNRNSFNEGMLLNTSLRFSEFYKLG